MIYTQEMMLRSVSGYCMPFEEHDKEVKALLGYGEQTHPQTGNRFFHHGIDFDVSYRPLKALASGIVCSVGSDPMYGIVQTVRYGGYEVRYCHVSNILAQFGSEVRAGQNIAVSGTMLHMDVTFSGKEIDPLEFISMLYANVEASRQPVSIEQEGYDFNMTRTFGANSEQELEALLVQYLPSYLSDLETGRYTMPQDSEMSLRSSLTATSSHNCFFEQLPSAANPLGIGRNAIPFAEKILKIIARDFRDYLMLIHGVSLAGEKKKTSAVC